MKKNYKAENTLCQVSCHSEEQSNEESPVTSLCHNIYDNVY